MSPPLFFALTAGVNCIRMRLALNNSQEKHNV